MMLRLTHSYSGQIVVLNKAVDKTLPRVRVNAGTIDYNASGSPVAKGTFFEPKFIWTFKVLATPAQYAGLQLIYGLSDYARRVLGNPAILIDDLTEPIFEPTQTRAIAENTTLTPIPGGVSYYAKFQAFFVRPPEAVEIANGYQVNFVLSELERVPP